MRIVESASADWFSAMYRASLYLSHFIYSLLLNTGRLVRSYNRTFVNSYVRTFECSSRQLLYTDNLALTLFSEHMCERHAGSN